MSCVAVVLDPLDRNVSDVRRWLTGISDDGDRSAGEQYLAGVVAQHQDPTSITARDLFVDAGAGFRRDDDPEAEVAALVQVGYWHHLQRDLSGLFAVAERIDELAARGVASAVPYATVSEAFVALVRGDSEGVLDAVRRVELRGATGALAATVEWLRSQGLELSGYPSVDAADACSAHGVRTAGYSVLSMSSR